MEIDVIGMKIRRTTEVPSLHSTAPVLRSVYQHKKPFVIGNIITCHVIWRERT